MEKILFYTDTPNIGGAEKQMLLLAKYLHKKGYRVSLAYGAYSKIATMHDDFDEWCDAIYVLPTIHKHDPRHHKRLKKVLKHGHFDLIHLHLWNPGSCRYAFFAAKKMGIPIVTTEHDPFELRGLKKKIKQNTLRKTDETIVISKANYGLLGDYYGQGENRLNLVHNGIEVDRFLDNVEPVKLPVKLEDIVVTCIAELHPRKGHQYLLKAFRKLQLEIPKLQLLLVGAGPLEDELKKEYGDFPNIHFLGWCKDVRPILKASDIFVLPSLKEAFGLVVLEAMASEVIAIGTKAGGVPDIIEDGKTGYLVPPGDSEKIVEAIFTILRNPDKKSEIEKVALARVKDHFTAERMAKNTIAVYAKVA